MNERVRLQVQGLALRAGGRPTQRLLFESLDFDVGAGQRWVVLGPNGAGKSSLLAALAGVFPRAAGAVCLQGRDLAKWPPRALADWRAWCPQFWVDPFPATVLETLRLVRNRAAWWPAAADGDDRELGRMLARLDLEALAEADVRTLSGGERQRVAVATALLQDAPLLLLDEPASHLDLRHQRLLIELLIAHAAGGGTVVASLHDLNLAAQLATHALLLDGGGGVASGPREEVLTPQRLTAAYGLAVDRVEICGEQRFWVGPLPGQPAAREMRMAASHPLRDAVAGCEGREDG
jgi:iron complex transport system ATP-binding protein